MPKRLRRGWLVAAALLGMLPCAGPAALAAGAELERFDGQLPFDAVRGTSFLDHRKVAAALRKVLGREGQRWLGRLDTAGAIARVGDVLVAAVCETDNCAGSNATMMFTVAGDLVAVCRFSGAGAHGAQRDTERWQGRDWEKLALDTDSLGCPNDGLQAVDTLRIIRNP
jgi:hypothetical protein